MDEAAKMIRAANDDWKNDALQEFKDLAELLKNMETRQDPNEDGKYLV